MVNSSLYTGLSGLRVHQRYIDVIGNNLANVSTPGFWGARATFSDILSNTIRPGSGPSGNFGGQNPLQVGLGATLASIDLRTTQGTFADTGRPLDVALQGKGFFTLTDGRQTVYTRVGAFGVDADRALIDLRTGYRVLSSSGSNITVPVTDTMPPRATGSVSFQGNLPATVTGPLEEIVESGTPLLSGTAARKIANPPGAGNTYNLSAFIDKTILVAVNGGAQQSISFPASAFANPAAATATEIANRIRSATGISVTAEDTTGDVTIDTVKLGESAKLKFDDGPSSSGLLTQLGLNAAMSPGTQSAATDTTNLGQLTARNAPYVVGDQITISGTNPNGNAVSNTFVYGTNGTTVADLITFINQTFDSTKVEATRRTDGSIRMTAKDKGPASVSLFIGDGPNNTGTTNWPNFRQVQDGKGPDTAVTSIDVIDSLGRTHPVTLTFTRSTTDASTWDLKATMDATEGTITSDTISAVRFNADGSFNVVGGGTNTFTFSFTGIGASQTVGVNLGTSGKFDGVAMLGNRTTVAATDQDGFTAGTLLNHAFDSSGQLLGYYTNGSTRTLGTLRITVFPNEGGLLRQGDTTFAQSPNSDDPIATTANAAGAGEVRAGALENSNVDIAEEFVNLIEAQRGFQANSRVITTTDEILAELVNIVR